MGFLRQFAGCLAALLLTGCAGYRLGPTNDLAAGAKSIQLGPFANQTMEPRLGDAFTTAMRRQVQQDGTYHLATHGAADVVVTGVLKTYNRYELAFVPKDVLTVSDYHVSLTAQITAHDTSTGKILFDQQVTGNTLIRVGSDLTSAERQALPQLADDLARNVTALLVDGNW